MGRRLLIVHPGASWSTHDVYVGLTAALREQGHDLYTYALDGRIERSVSWLRLCYDAERMAGRMDTPEPTQGDFLMHATSGILERAAFFHVHAILIISGMYVPRRVLQGLRWFSVPTGLVLTESPYDDEHEARWAELVDVVWTNDRTSVAPLRLVNRNAHYLPAAYDPFRHQPYPQMDDDTTPAHDVVFVGTGFPERIDLLSRVDWSGIDLGLYGNWDVVTEAGESHPLHRFVRAGVITNESAASLYRRAKIGLNLYRTSRGFYGDDGHVSTAESLNPRAYELAAVGCFQIATHRAEADDVFTIPGAGIKAIGSIYPAVSKTAKRTAGGLIHVEEYDPAQHLADQIRDHLDGGMRREYARAAMELVRPHTFDARARQLMAQFEPTLTDRWGPPEPDETVAPELVAAYGD